MRRLLLVALLGATVPVLAACGGGETEPASAPEPAASAPTETGAAETAPAGQAPGADPRDGGFEVALGEWAVTTEAESIRPGRAVFVITNRGTMPHGFEIEREDDEESGSGSGGDGGKVETRVLQPGETAEVELKLSEGVYKLECNVEGHDDMGMEMLLEVRAGAPLAAAPAPAPAATAVAVEGFAFTPATISAAVGQEIAWENLDPADHTVTAEDAAFDSGTMAQGATFATTFDNPGEYRYICALHPGMKGKVIVR